MKRIVEVFTAGCPLCSPVVELVKSVACGNCDVLTHNLTETEAGNPALRRARLLEGRGHHPRSLGTGWYRASCLTRPYAGHGLRPLSGLVAVVGRFTPILLLYETESVDVEHCCLTGRWCTVRLYQPDQNGGLSFEGYT
jgi:hypothetical protein